MISNKLFLLALLFLLNTYVLTTSINPEIEELNILGKDDLETSTEHKDAFFSSATSDSSEWTTFNQNKPSSVKNLTDKNKPPSYLTALVRSQLKKELRKLKSTITDSIMEELINYYGKKLEQTDALKQEMDNLNKKVNLLSQNLNTIGQNYKSLSKNHRNLVDVVRNNIINLKKEKEQERKLQNPLISRNVLIKNTSNTRAINENLKKKSVDSNKPTTLGTKSTFLTNVMTKIASPMPETSTNQMKSKLIETKYSHLIEDKLVKNESKLEMAQNDEDNEDDNGDLIDNEMPVNNYDSRLKVRHEEYKNLKNEKKVEAKKTVAHDCQDLYADGFSINGVYKVYLPKSNASFDVYCEFQNKIGWTLLQRRNDGSVNFYQNWKAYKNGFGNMLNNGEFWLGLEYIHALTSNDNYSLQIVMTDWKNEEYTAEYELFKVDDEKNKYKLEISKYLNDKSTAGDSLGSINSETSHNNMPFSTFDSDNDMRFYDNCAQIFKAGWWFNACFQSNLNGIYYHYTNPNDNSQLRFLRNGIHWNSIDFYKSLKSTKLRIRPRYL